ncbi:10980_t:CDS:2 [Ambispora gerdemannii]|uniref:10980_t:CDS:1 n=1 Tax=Ambispora gerdemannii TaxID=144530 RepID=A0A9N8VKA1_9GLOM|nr:10980_t:CDS:2 [Ambispora gerdemannii]
MACFSEVRLPIEYGRITREGFPSELYGYLTPAKYNQRVDSYNRLCTKHRHRSCMACIPPHLFAIIAMSIIVPLFILKQQNDMNDKPSKVNFVWLLALMPVVAIISLSWMWMLSKRLKTRLLKDTKDLIATFNEQDTPQIGVSWRFQSHRTENDDFAEEFLVITLPNVRLSQTPTLRHQSSDTTMVAFPIYDYTALTPIPAAQISPREERHNVDLHTLITISPPSYNDATSQNDTSSMRSVKASTSPRRNSFSNRPSNLIAGSSNRGHRVDYDTLQIINYKQ